MYKLLRPLLFGLSSDPETVHNLALSFLKLAGKNPIRSIASSLANFESPMLEQKLFGLDFKNPVGLGAGFDKNGSTVDGLAALGFGFIEVGTITKLPQAGNPRQRMFRLVEDEALINRMGFNNLGVEVLKQNLAGRPRTSSVLGISLGKNKDTALENAKDDYLFCFRELYDSGDYFVVNVSSPNTPNLRQLQDKSFLVDILSALKNHRASQKIQKPVLVKIAPDLTLEAIDEVLSVCRDESIDGVIATNTTISRDGLKTQIKEAGGLSGRPVKEKSTEIIRHIYKQMPVMPIIGVGGIFTAEDAYEKIKAGASLIQIYTGFIYEGPFVAKKINQGLVKLLERDGLKKVGEAVGKE